MEVAREEGGEVEKDEVTKVEAEAKATAADKAGGGERRKSRSGRRA